MSQRLEQDEPANGNNTENESHSSSTTIPDSNTSMLFGKSSKLTRAPKPDITLGKTAPTRSATKATSSAPVVSLRSRGFWKILTKFDVSQTSAPGQMIIPKMFSGLFPTTTPSTGTGAGYQTEISFSLQFKDGKHTETVNDARYIHYTPKPGHPRPNTDNRFTFHNQTILVRLKRGDMLVFKLTRNPKVKFVIERLDATDNRYAALYKGIGQSYGMLP